MMDAEIMADSNASILKIKHSSLQLDSKPSITSIQYSYITNLDSTEDTPLLVFLNGLMTDKASWLAIMAKLNQVMSNCPTMLAYDRYGQGMTEDRNPQDQHREPGYGYDCQDVARDLHQLVLQFKEKHLRSGHGPPSLIFVASSIGCAIARLYAQEYPGTVTGLLLLDSIIANSNFDFWPNPDAPDFDPSFMPEDVTVKILKEQRAAFAAMFNPSVKNPEGLDRRNLATLLPYSDRPKLQGPDNAGPVIRVVGHDPQAFAEEGLQVSPCPANSKA